MLVCQPTLRSRQFWLVAAYIQLLADLSLIGMQEGVVSTAQHTPEAHGAHLQPDWSTSTNIVSAQTSVWHVQGAELYRQLEGASGVR